MSTALTGIFSNGVAGMMAFSEAMGTISDNISNQNTVGYKRVETMFSTLLGRQESAVQGDNFAPHLIARNTSGLRTFTRQAVDVQGAILSTGRQYDLAISGGGMFLFGNGTVSGGALTVDTGSPLYSRAGDLNALVPADLTTATVTGTTDAYLANKNGQFLLAQPFTAADLAAGVTTPSGDLEPVQVSNQAAFAGQATATAALSAVIPATGATTVSTPIHYVDSVGDSQGLTLEFSNPTVTSGVSTDWDITVYNSSGAIVTGPLAAAVTFDNDGEISAGSPLSITAGGVTFSLDLDDVAMLGDAAVTGAGNQAIQQNYEQDGIPEGAFIGLTIREDGVIFGNYEGGATQPLYRIPIATFASPNALEAVAGNMYQATVGAGDVELRFPGDEFARLELESVENSNVDLADQFANMIVTQRAYSSAAQIVTTADQMSVVARDLI